MRQAETILSVIRERGKQGLPLERVYRLLFNRELYLHAYAKLYPNDGAMTKGSTSETVDGMSLAKIEHLISQLQPETFKWTPVRRVHIPKSNGKTRPLGIPTWNDKLLQEVIRMILEAYFEPQFSDHAHGFRPARGCHTALNEIRHTWTGTKWFIEGDIKQCFDTINHNKLIEILARKIHDGRFLRLINELLKAGYVEDWKWGRTLSGTPQGGIVSPLLSNIYLNEFDQWIQTLISEYTLGTRRKVNKAYSRIRNRLFYMRERGITEGAAGLLKERRKYPVGNPNDPGYRRLKYVRYADDFILGLIGTKEEAETIKRRIKEWFQTNLELTLSDEKTLITHATTESARFLGYEIAVQNAPDKLDPHGGRRTNGTIQLRVPKDVVSKRCQKYVDGTEKPIHRKELTEESDYSIVTNYQQEYRGIVQYYLLASNVSRFSQLHWVMQTSLLKTLANKHKTTVPAITRKYKTTTRTPQGKILRCIEVRVEREGKAPLIARFGGISLTRQADAILREVLPPPMKHRSELIERLQADECELCGSRVNVQVHHIRKLADLKRRGRKPRPQWVENMAARRRKTLVVCHDCHCAIHAGRPTRQKDHGTTTGEPCAGKLASTVREGADGKGQ